MAKWVYASIQNAAYNLDQAVQLFLDDQGTEGWRVQAVFVTSTTKVDISAGFSTKQAAIDWVTGLFTSTQITVR
jgi:hypothetical protein